MSHRDHHPSPMDWCFGCKVASVGYDGRHLTRTVTDENQASTTEHRSGRQDVTVRAPRVALRTTQTEER